MSQRRGRNPWPALFSSSLQAMSRQAMRSGTRALGRILARPPTRRTAPAPAAGTWSLGVALGAAGAKRFRLYRPSGVAPGEQLPLMVMLHGCGQDANGFAASTRMNRIAQRERFLVLYPEQDRLANPQSCWNWFDTRSGRAQGEVALIMQAIDQACLLHPADRTRVAMAGLSAGASMAALVVARHPERFRALVMHSGVAPGNAHSGLSALKAMQGRHSPPQPLVSAPAPGWAPADKSLAPGPALLVIHGEADTVVSPRNGPAAAQSWAAARGARAGAMRRVQRGSRHAMQVTDFKHRGRTVARLVQVAGLAHAWSGGAAGQAYGDPRGPDASRLAWRFAAQQFRA